ncbi:hypothetical protein ACJQWY_03845 [Weissella kandleri]|uniref:hypothetical protein n=1 Tax=Weissella kandleri TaxID=1616 RepID=UPI00387E977D
MKNKGRLLLIIILAIIFVWSGQRSVNQLLAQQNIKTARKSVQQADWITAQQAYQKAQARVPSVESRTSLEQLDLLIAGDKAAEAGNLTVMKQDYQRALRVNGGMRRINQRIQAKLQQNDAEAERSKASSATQKKRTSKTALAKKHPAASDKTETADWSQASSNNLATPSANLADAYQFSNADIETARAELARTYPNAENYDDMNIKKVMAMSLLNKTSITEAYQAGGWNQMRSY